MENKRKITAEEVLTTIKDDGDFDKLRLKVIRKLKDDGELRNSIISMVKQSAALNRPGAESMKPRQLSDAIHQEIGDNVMSQISDGIWQILRSSDQMKTEITETVQSIYNKLSNPKVNEDGESSSPSVLIPVSEGHQNDRCAAASLSEVHVRLSEGEPNEPPGFSQFDRGCNDRNKHEDRAKDRLRMSMPCDGRTRIEVVKEVTSSSDALEQERAHPGLREMVEPTRSDANVDDDPDVPPGFG